MILTPEHVLGGMALLGGVIVILNRLGLLSFGKKVCPIKACPDPECQQDVKITKIVVTELKADCKAMDEKIDTIAKGVAFIQGKINATG